MLGFVSNVLSTNDARFCEKSITVPVLMAAKYIPAHTTVTMEHIYVAQLDSRLRNEKAIHDPALVIGKETAIPIGQDEQFATWKLDENQLFPNPHESFFTFQADTISTVGNLVRRGDVVQIWLEVDSIALQSETGQTDNMDHPSVLLVIPDAKVAYVKDAQGNEVVDEEEIKVDRLLYQNGTVNDNSANNEKFRKSASAETSFITYILTREQYEQIVLAQRYGRLKMGLQWPFRTQMDPIERLNAAGISAGAGDRYSFSNWFAKKEGGM